MSAQGTPLPDLARQSSDARWAAWQARGAAHDRALRRRLQMAAAPVIGAAGLLLYFLLTR